MKLFLALLLFLTTGCTQMEKNEVNSRKVATTYHGSRCIIPSVNIICSLSKLTDMSKPGDDCYCEDSSLKHFGSVVLSKRTDEEPEDLKCIAVNNKISNWCLVSPHPIGSPCQCGSISGTAWQ